MNAIKEFGNTAISLSRNPLGIIALFIVLIYGFAAIVVGGSSQLEVGERAPLIWFLVLFPVVVISVFSWLVSKHYEKLYAPRDYISDESFLKTLEAGSEERRGLRNLEPLIEKKVRSVLNSEDLLADDENREELQQKLQLAADTITEEIKNTSFLTIDISDITGDEKDVFEVPILAFSTLNDLTNEIYFSISSYVNPYEYGHTWAMKLSDSHGVIQNARMITGTRAGVPLSDKRRLEDVGINPGAMLLVVNLKNS